MSVMRLAEIGYAVLQVNPGVYPSFFITAHAEHAFEQIPEKQWNKNNFTVDQLENIKKAKTWFQLFILPARITLKEFLPSSFNHLICSIKLKCFTGSFRYVYQNIWLMFFQD